VAGPVHGYVWLHALIHKAKPPPYGSYMIAVRWNHIKG
jgi:hypothetical protein